MTHSYYSVDINLHVKIQYGTLRLGSYLLSAKWNHPVTQLFYVIIFVTIILISLECLI